MKKLIAAIAPIALLASPAVAGGNTLHISGNGTYTDGRHFVLSATVHKNGTASGHATLINRNFGAENGSNAPYIANIKISCVKVVEGAIILGGETTSTNDPNLDDAVFFAVRDDGNALSAAYFWDDDPTTTGIPGNCIFNDADDYPTNELIQGSFRIR